jgi:hypothetical protein
MLDVIVSTSISINAMLSLFDVGSEKTTTTFPPVDSLAVHPEGSSNEKKFSLFV